jgi:2-phosphosulfolactate phosphatase
MEVNILQLVEGAKAARGVTVVIDVFRAFSLEAYLFSEGVEKIIPIGSVDDARKLKNDNPEYILAGERHGKILEGFDTGNAPSLIHLLDLEGKTVVHTTSAGTQGIANAQNASEILGCGLVNARATAEYIRKSGAEAVSLVCMGLEALAPTEEDTLCARYIKSLLLDEQIDMKSEIESLKFTSGAKFFDKAQNDVFPERDFYMCTDLDKFSFVMRITDGDDGIRYMEKVDV